MSAKKLFGAVLLATWVTCAAARGQEVLSPPVPTAPDAPAGGAAIPAGPLTGPAPGPGCSAGLSDWILYKRECCNGPLGEYRPLCMEIFLRAGTSLPFGGQAAGNELKVGSTIMAGGRALFFNPAKTTAFTVEAHILNSQNQADGERQFPLSIIEPGENGAQRVNFGSGNIPGVTIRRMSRTMVGVGLGREWYPWQPAGDPHTKWRVGVDAGGRYGSASMRFNEIRHRTDVIGSAFAAAHSDLEIPCGPCVLQTGVRLEYAYTWSDILQRTSDVQELNLLFTLGLRY